MTVAEAAAIQNALVELRNKIESIVVEESKHDEKWAQGLKYSLKIIDEWILKNPVILEGPRPSEVRPLMSNDFYITRGMFGKSELIGPDEHAIFDAKNGTITIVKNDKPHLDGNNSSGLVIDEFIKGEEDEKDIN